MLKAEKKKQSTTKNFFAEAKDNWDAMVACKETEQQVVRETN